MHINKAIKEYHLKNGEKRFMFKIYLGVDPLTGKEITTTRRGFKKTKEAQLAYNRLKFEFNNGTYKKKQTVKYRDVYKEWLVHYENKVEESTFVKTEGLFENHILPAMGEYKIDKIEYSICQKHVDEWAKKLVNFDKLKVYASNVMHEAVKRKYINSNPFTLVELPKKHPTVKNDNYYTKEQLLIFLECTSKMQNAQRYSFFHLLSETGMRKGEALAITWEDIDFNENTIDINKALSIGKDNNKYLKSTKTESPRKIFIDQETMSKLASWKDIQSKQLHQLGCNYNPSNQLLFSNRYNEYVHPANTNNWIKKIQKKFNLKKISTHGLRHTHATLLTEAGAKLVGVKQRIGHSSKDITTQIYIHVTEKTQKETLEKYIEYMKS